MNRLTEGSLVIEERLIEQMQDVITDKKLDAIMFVFPNGGGDPFFGTSQFISDYGMYNRSVLGISNRIAYVYARYLLYDAKLHLRFKAGSIIGSKQLAATRHDQLKKEHVMDAVSTGLDEVSKPLHLKLKQHEYINTKLRK